jgi:hypothetical protein
VIKGGKNITIFVEKPKIKVKKAKFTLEQDMKAQSWSRVIPLLFL